MERQMIHGPGCFLRSSVFVLLLASCSKQGEGPAARSAAGPDSPESAAEPAENAEAVESPPMEDQEASSQAAPPQESSNQERPETSRASDESSPSAEGGAVDLQVPGFEPALVAFPEGSGPFPVLFATHGAGGQAEHVCTFWLTVLDEPTIIVCPRGTRVAKNDAGGGYYYPTHFALEKEVLAITRELEKRSSVGPKPWIYTGYSQGATMGALMVVNHGDLFDRLVLLEGGTEGWTRARADKYARSGGRKALFGCGTDTCSEGADKAAKAMAEGGLDVRVRMAEGAGHTYAGGVRKVITPDLNWVFMASSSELP